MSFIWQTPFQTASLHILQPATHATATHMSPICHHFQGFGSLTTIHSPHHLSVLYSFLSVNKILRKWRASHFHTFFCILVFWLMSLTKTPQSGLTRVCSSRHSRHAQSRPQSLTYMGRIQRLNQRMSYPLTKMLLLILMRQTQNQSHSTPFLTPLCSNPVISNTKSNNRAYTHNNKFYTKKWSLPIMNANAKQITFNTRSNTKAAMFNFKSSLSLHQAWHTQCQIPAALDQPHPISKSFTQQ